MQVKPALGHVAIAQLYHQVLARDNISGQGDNLSTGMRKSIAPLVTRGAMDLRVAVEILLGCANPLHPW